MATIIQPQVEYARLERQNRMLKRVGFFLFVLCFLCIGLIAWQLRKLSHGLALGHTKMISANQFNLLDQNGKVQGLLSGSEGGAMLFLNGPDGKTGLMFAPGPDKGSSLSLESSDGGQQITLNTSDLFSWVNIGTKDDTGDKISLTAGAADRMTVSDKAGFELVLGSASLVRPESGDSHNTSAATVTLFGKDGRVLWMTPKP